MKRVLLLFFFACCLLGRPALASDQKLVHGAGTLPHLTSAITLSVGAEMPTPVQLGIAASVTWIFNSVEIHSMFNVFNTARDSDFLSLYLNPGILNAKGDDTYFGFRTGIAYEHRFGNQRHIGLYTKVSVLVPLVQISDGNARWIDSTDMIGLDWRAGFQVLTGERFSIAVELMLIFVDPIISQPGFGFKVALTWAL
jgi:hypothetical protein